LDLVVCIDFENSDGNFLSARAGEGDEEVAFAVEGGVGDRMQFLGDGDSDADFDGVTLVAVGADDDGAGGSIFGDGGHDEIVGAHEDGSGDVADLDGGALIVWRSQRSAAEADFTSGKYGARLDSVEARMAVNVFLA
jgi:hypothetical protein